MKDVVETVYSLNLAYFTGTTREVDLTESVYSLSCVYSLNISETQSSGYIRGRLPADGTGDSLYICYPRRDAIQMYD
jgi:hypothetical protein